MKKLKIELKPDNVIPWGGIFIVLDHFDRTIAPIIDKKLGERCKSYGYKYSEVIRTLMSVYFCGGGCVEDINKILNKALKHHPTLKSCSPDTVHRMFEKLATDSEKYTSNEGKTYDFNTAENLNGLLLSVLSDTGYFDPEKEYDLDFDHNYLETEKFDTKKTYKKFLGYCIAAAVIGDMIVGIEGIDGNNQVTFMQEKTLERLFLRLKEIGVKLNRFRADCGSYTKEVVKMVRKHCKLFYIRAKRSDLLEQKVYEIKDWKSVEINNKQCELAFITVKGWEDKDSELRLVIQRQERKLEDKTLFDDGKYEYRSILTNDFDSSEKEIVEYYNKRGGKERIFDEMNNEFGWKRLPKSFLNENTVYLIITSLIHNYYRTIIGQISVEDFGLEKTSRMKAFRFNFISVSAKWIRTSRQNVLNLYSDNPAYLRALRQ